MANHIECAASFARTDDGTITAHDDGRLLFGDRLNGVAQVLLVIQADIRHDGNSAIPRMRGVKSSAKADLNNRGSDLFLTERFEDCADEDLKLRRWPDPLLDLVGGIKGARNRLGEREWGEWLSVDLHPLAVADQVRFWGGGVASSRRAERR